MTGFELQTPTRLTCACRVLAPLAMYGRDNELMTKVHLQGRLVCRDEQEAALVTTHLPRHVELTRAETGCISFTVTPTADPLVWSVDKVFHDAAAFRRHQDRVRASEWGRATAPIERDYAIDGL